MRAASTVPIPGTYLAAEELRDLLLGELLLVLSPEVAVDVVVLRVVDGAVVTLVSVVPDAPAGPGLVDDPAEVVGASPSGDPLPGDLKELPCWSRKGAKLSSRRRC